jgi:SagB-type dehydrogenase family enzyme
LRAAKKAKKRKVAAPVVSARLNGQINLEVHADGNVVAQFDGMSVALGKFSAAALNRVKDLPAGLPLKSFASSKYAVDREVELLVQRLARTGLLEYRLGMPGEAHDQVVIEPQLPDYWPHAPKLGDSDRIVMSRFAYLRRRGNDMVLESPRAGALFRICDPAIATALALLATPQTIRKLRKLDGFPGSELFALLVDCEILFKTGVVGNEGLRADEGDASLVVWDFHDLLFHTRSTEGRHANPLGGLYPHLDSIPPWPAVRPSWPGQKIDLRKHTAADQQPMSSFPTLLHLRHSSREFDDHNPITLAEVARLLDSAARVGLTWTSGPDHGGDGPMIEYAARPYPSGGASYELELYLAVNTCEGLAAGFYHYDAGDHALVPIEVGKHGLEALLKSSEYATGASAPPQILITIAARFGRVSWKYSSVAYGLILKDAGVLTQSLYLMATDMGLGGCAIGSTNIDLFAKLTGMPFHVEGPVGQFALGRAIIDETPGGEADEPAGH